MGDLKIVQKNTPFEIHVKRFYFPVSFEWICGGCKQVNVMDFDDDYLSYPVVNKKWQITCAVSLVDTNRRSNTRLNLNLKLFQTLITKKLLNESIS